jgi:hypothetical protein
MCLIVLDGYNLPPVMRAVFPSRENRSAMGGMADMLTVSEAIF